MKKKSKNTNNNMHNTPAISGILHGECLIFKSVLPADVVEENLPDGNVIIADSETTGNHHVIEKKPGVKFYHNSKGARFMENTVPTDVKCVVADRHDAVTLQPGVWEIDFQQEYDYFTESMRQVRD